MTSSPSSGPLKQRKWGPFRRNRPRESNLTWMLTSSSSSFFDWMAFDFLDSSTQNNGFSTPWAKWHSLKSASGLWSWFTFVSTSSTHVSLRENFPRANLREASWEMPACLPVCLSTGLSLFSSSVHQAPFQNQRASFLYPRSRSSLEIGLGSGVLFPFARSFRSSRWDGGGRGCSWSHWCSILERDQRRLVVDGFAFRRLNWGSWRGSTKTEEVLTQLDLCLFGEMTDFDGLPGLNLAHWQPLIIQSAKGEDGRKEVKRRNFACYELWRRILVHTCSSLADGWWFIKKSLDVKWLMKPMLNAFQKLPFVFELPILTKKGRFQTRRFLIPL